MKRLINFAVLILAWISAEAQTYVHQGAIGNNDGTSWTNAFTNLQDALDAAPPGSQIWIAAGTYVPDGPTPDSSHFLTLKSFEFYGGFSGTESSLAERDLEANLTILSGDKNGDDVTGDFLNYRMDNAHHVLIVNAPIGNTIIDGIVFQGGMTRVDAFAPDATDVPYHRWRGGGLYIYRSRNVVRNCTFRDNYGLQGTGMYAAGDSTQSRPLVLENSLFELNSGVIAGACWIAGWNDAIIRKCIFRNNNSTNHSAAMTLGNMHATIEDCSFYQNSASSQGGVCLIFNSFSVVSNPSYHFFRSDFVENTATGTGGAIRLNNFDASVNLFVDSCAFSQNYTTNIYGSAGAIYVVDYNDTITNELTGIVRIDRTTFDGNSSAYGGAVEIDGGDDSLQVTVTNSTFLNNTATNSGGALYVWMLETSNVHTQIEQSSFDGNTALVGGGLILDSYNNIARMSYGIDNCRFINNAAESEGGAIGQFLTNGPGLIGSISNSEFLNNEGLQGGALISLQEDLLVENCLFSENYAAGFKQSIAGGGAILFEGPADINVRNSIFENNNSEVEGSAVFSGLEVYARFENVLFRDNQGISTFGNQGGLQLLNTTMSNNEYGILLQDNNYVEIQNSIFNNVNENLRIQDSPDIISLGGNVSSDSTMSAVLTGNGNFEDLHNTDPLLGADFVPLSGSPCIDAGNPEGIDFPYDLAGNPRVHGGAIDIGSYESFLVATHDAQWNASSFKVYPNPVKDNLHFILEMEAIGDLNLTLYSSTGQVVHRARLSKTDFRQSFSENVTQVSPGEYVVVLDLNGSTYATSIIVQP